MIQFVQIVPKKICKIFYLDEEIAELELANPSSITNKFNLITEFVEDMCKVLGDEFINWFVDFFRNLYSNTCGYCTRFNSDSACTLARAGGIGNGKKYTIEEVINIRKICTKLSYEEEKRTNLILNNIEKIRYFVDKYIDILKPDFSAFVNEEKAKKTSILFGVAEIEKIMRLSSYLKVYILISNSENIKLDIRFHKKIFNILLEQIDKSTIEKIFEIIKTKTFRYKQTDQFMWEYIKMIQCKEIEIYIVEIFNFLMNNIMVLCKLDKNPITFFVTVVDSAIIWILRSVYRTSIIYNDEITSSDIQTIKINNLRTYACNDTIGRIRLLANEHIGKKLEEDTNSQFSMNINQREVEFRNRMNNLKTKSPLIDLLVYPIFSKITKIPYQHFQSLNFEYSAILASYLRHLLTRVFQDDYKTFFELLDYYLDEKPHETTTYEIKQVEHHINTFNKTLNFIFEDFKNGKSVGGKFMGFNTVVFQRNFYGYVVGMLKGLRFKNIFTALELSNLQMNVIEQEIITFYNYFFAGLWDDKQFAVIENELNKSISV